VASPPGVQSFGGLTAAPLNLSLGKGKKREEEILEGEGGEVLNNFELAA